MDMAGKVKGTFWIQETRNTQLIFCEGKGVLQILPVAPSPHHIHINQVWPDGMHHWLKRNAITPTGTKVLYLNSMIP